MALVTYNSTLNEWENIIRVTLKVANPALLKSGALGILTNYLAGIKYDALQFYSKAFQEMNVGLAQDFNSMLYHSTIYGANLEFAQPATLSSSLIVPEIRLAEISEIVYTIPRFTTFKDTNGIPFLYSSEIKMSMTNKCISGISWNPYEGNRKLTITKAPNPNIPGANVFLIHNSDAEQYQRQFHDKVIPVYEVGDAFSFSIGIETVENLKSIECWINTGRALDQQELDTLRKIDPEDIEGSFTNIPNKLPANITKMDLKFHKFDSSIKDINTIFVKIQESSLNFETGDGIHGAILPQGSQLIIELQETMGVFGNVQNCEYIISGANVQEKYNTGVIRNPIPTTLNGLSVTGSYGGKNIEQVDGIRENIFNQISSRNSIISENDYEKLFKYQDIKPFVDAKFLDARAFVFIFNVIHDNDQIVKSTSINYKENLLANNPFYPLYTYNGVELVSPFYYKNSRSNTIDAYIVDPKIIFSLNERLIEETGYTAAEYRVDVALTYEFQRTQNGMTGTSFIEIQGTPDPDYEYHFYASWLGVGAYLPLNVGNGFKYEINSLYTDEFCIVRENTTDVRLQVFDINSSTSSLYEKTLVAEYSDSGEYNQLQKKQEFYKYFDILPEDETPVPTDTYSVGYLDNYLEDIMSTPTDVFEVSVEENYEPILLRLPFIDEQWFWGKTPEEVYEVLDNYFIVDGIKENINFNTQLTQAFHNTIDIPDKYFPYIFDKNTNGILDTPKLSLDIELFLNSDHFLSSKFKTEADFEIALKIACIKFMKDREGFSIDYYETDLEKMIYNLFNPIVRNVKVKSPTLFMVNDSSQIYAGIQENESFNDVLNFVPPYFYYDYTNINILINM